MPKSNKLRLVESHPEKKSKILKTTGYYTESVENFRAKFKNISCEGAKDANRY